MYPGWSTKNFWLSFPTRIRSDSYDTIRLGIQSTSRIIALTDVDLTPRLARLQLRSGSRRDPDVILHCVVLLTVRACRLLARTLR